MSAGALRRVALWVPDWPAQAAVVEGAAGPETPVAVHDPRGRVRVASAGARRAGVRRGMRTRTARQLCPGLLTLPGDEIRDARAFEPLVQAVEEVVAEVTVLRPGVLLLPAEGPARHAGSEERLAETLVGTVAEATGAECQVGAADGLLAALLAARAGILVPAGGSAGFLTGHDIAALSLLPASRAAAAETEEAVDLLRRLGLRTLGAFAALDPGDVSARLGAHGRTLHRLARGLDARAPSARRPEEDVHAALDLDPPADRADVAAFAARSLAEDLVDQLLRRGGGAARLRVSARTEDGAELARVWGLDDAPDATDFTDRVRWQLEGWLSGRSGRPPSAPLTRLELLAQEVAPTAQDGLWGRRRRGEERARRAALRVQGLLGPEGVMLPVLQGGRDPRDTVRLVSWGDEAAPARRTDAPWPGQVPPPWPATVPEVPVTVRLLDAAGREVGPADRDALTGEPAWLHIPPPGRGTDPLLPPGEYRLTARSALWYGRERWWTPQGRRWIRLQVLPEDLPVLLLLRESGAWHLDGVYD